jgi:hypothetical protein
VFVSIRFKKLTENGSSLSVYIYIYIYVCVCVCGIDKLHAHSMCLESTASPNVIIGKLNTDLVDIELI